MVNRLAHLSLLLAAGVAGLAGIVEHSELRSGELEALRQVLEAEIDTDRFQRVEVGEHLELRWDSRHQRQQALSALLESDAAITPELVESFEVRNRKKLSLWPRARRILGEEADKRVFLIADPLGLHVQYARMGWDDSGQRGLVYLELRPRGGSESMRATFRVVQRTPSGWSVEPIRSAVDRGGSLRELGD